MIFFRWAGLLMFFSLFISFSVQAQQGREIKRIDKHWQFYKGTINKNTDTNALAWKEINIPHTWNNIDMQRDTTYYEGDGWYKKTLFLPEKYKDKRLFIKFEGVGNVADIYVNGRFMGEHKGGYAAFIYEITDAVHFGKNNLVMVRANNKLRPDVIPINHRLFANYGGIYRHVNLIVTNKLNISTLDYASPGVYVDQYDVSEESAHLSVEVKIENKYPHTQEVKVKAALEDAEGQLAQASAIDGSISPQGTTIMNLPLPVLQPHLWNGRNDPYLYTLRVQIIKDGQIRDEVSRQIGIRSFHIEAGKGFFLNNKPYKLYGVCRHQDWWGYGNALTDSMQRVDMQMIADIGATSVRFAHYQQADLIYHLCDSLGILAWAEIPFVNASSGKEEANAKQQFTELIKQNYNHPSIFVWGLHNEVYTKYPTGYPARLTRELNDLAKTLDSYRYTVSTNGHGTMNRPMNRMADIQGMNRYYGWYEGEMDDINKWLEGLEENYPDYNVVLSEYGAGANIEQHTEDVKKPEQVISGQFFPEEYQTKLHIHQWAAIEKHAYLLSSYVWNMFDFCVPGWNRGGVPDRNLKGLVTFDRQTRKDAFYWYKANWSEKPVLHLTGRRNKKRDNRSQRIEVFSNLGAPVLFLNEKEQKSPEKGVNDKDWVWPSLRLKKGENILKVVKKAGDKEYSDTISLYFKK